jgi:hypothetical protein
MDSFCCQSCLSRRDVKRKEVSLSRPSKRIVSQSQAPSINAGASPILATPSKVSCQLPEILFWKKEKIKKNDKTDNEKFQTNSDSKNWSFGFGGNCC